MPGLLGSAGHCFARNQGILPDSFSGRSKFHVNFVFGRARLPHERGMEALAMCRDAPGCPVCARHPLKTTDRVWIK
jgi:hypothetical protein